MDAGLRTAGRDPGHPGAGMAGHFDSRRGNPDRRVPAGEHAVAALSSTCTTRSRTSRPSLTYTRRCGYAISAEDVALAATDEAEYAVGSPPSRRCSCGHRPQRRSPTMTTTSMACTHTTSTPRGFCRPNSDRAADLRRHQPQCQPVCVDARHLRPERVHRQDSLRRGRRVLTSAAATVTEGTLGQACTHTPTSMGSSA